MLCLHPQVLLHHRRVLGEGEVVHRHHSITALTAVKGAAPGVRAPRRHCGRLCGVSARGAPTDRDLAALGASVGRRALAVGARIATAESCTAGWVAKALTDTPGSSGWFECGFVTYSDVAKRRDLGVSARTLRRHGAVSQQTVHEMARGALRSAGVEIALAVSGIAGPDGGTPGKPVGTVWFCAAVRTASSIALTPSRKLFRGNRDAIRRKSVAHALRLIGRLVSHARRSPS